MQFTAVIFGAPVSKNEGQRVDFRRGHSFITPAARDFQRRVRLAVREAQEKSDWPNRPFHVDHVRISIYKYNTKADHDAGNTYIVDCLQYQKMGAKEFADKQPWGLYYNDNTVSLGECPRAESDGGEARIEIRFELLVIVSDIEATARHERWVAQEDRRKTKRRNKARKARQAKKEKQNES